MGYSDARDSLSDFLPEAVRNGQRFRFNEKTADRSQVVLREATSMEVHRMKGEWARRALRIVKANFPEAFPVYAAEASRLLEGPYNRGERDPQLIASLGLLRLDLGDMEGGRRLLEENPAAEAARPLAGVELANLRLAAALGVEPGKILISDDQAHTILDGLSGAFASQPPIEAAYAVAARLSKHLGRDPTGPERAHLDSGARFFPRNSQAVMECISWDLRANDAASARRLAELGEYEAADAPTLAKFYILDSLILTASASRN
jgi:hypothetical protein